MVVLRSRTALALVAGAVVASASFASAASLGGISARELAAGRAAVGSCDSDGVGVTYTTSSGTVQSITVTGVAAGCAGGSLRATLANSSGANIGAGGPITVAGTSVTVSLSPQPSSATVASAHVSITGP